MSIPLFFLFGCGEGGRRPADSEAVRSEWHVSVSGSNRNSGARKSPFRTISRAAERAMPGDAVIVHEGVYREEIRPPRGGLGEDERIVYKAAENANVVVKGSEPIKDWEPISENVWQVSISNSFFKGFNPYALNMEGGWLECGKWHHRGEVYLNGVSLFEKQTREEVDAHEQTWIAEVGESQTVIAANFGGVDPTRERVEINVRPAFVTPERTGLNYITIAGFHFEHAAASWAAPVLVGGTPEEKAAYRQEGGISTRMGKRWIIRNNHITDVKGVGISIGKDAHAVGENPYEDLDSYGDHEIHDNYIARCGQSAITGFYGGTRSLIRENLIEDINWKQQYGGWETAAIKLHGAVDVMIEGNLIRRVYKAEEGGAYGIWLDMSNQSIRLSRNIIYETEEYAVYLEMNAGPILMDNNVIFGPVRYRGSQAVVSAHNIYIDSKFSFKNEDEREAAVYEPHTRIFIRKASGIVQDNRFFNDVHIRSGTAKEFYEQPGIQSGGNLYLEHTGERSGAEPNSRIDPDFVTQVDRIDWPDGVLIRLRLPETIQEMKCPRVNPDLAGTFSTAGCSIEDRFGDPIRVDTDMYGHKRKRPLPGALAVPRSENEIIWKF